MLISDRKGGLAGRVSPALAAMDRLDVRLERPSNSLESTGGYHLPVTHEKNDNHHRMFEPEHGNVPQQEARNAKPQECDPMNDEASYICDNCGEEIVVPIDLAAGRSQSYVEDCPVCCSPNVIVVEIDEDGEAWADATAE